MQPNNNDSNMSTLNSPAENGKPNGLSSSDNTVNTNQQPVVNQQSENSKKPKKGLVITCLIILALLIIGVVVAVVMMNSNSQGSSGDEQSDTSNEVIEEDDEDEIEVGEPIVEIEQTGTAEVENGSFFIKDQSGSVIVEDNEMTGIIGIKSCETLENDIQTSVRCVVSTADGEGFYVYYPEENVLKYAE